MNDGQVPEVCLPLAPSLKQPGQPHKPNSTPHKKKLALGGTSPHRSRKHVHIPIKHSKRQLFLGCLSQSRAQAARFPARLSLPLAVGKIKLL